MFEARKLVKSRKTGEMFLKHARREMDRTPKLFKPADRQQIDQKLQSLENSLRGDDRHDIDNSLKEARRSLDRLLPLYRHTTVREYAEMIIVALVLAMFIRTFIVQAFKIPSGSMIPTLRIGDHILVNKFLYGIKFPFIDKKIPLTKPQRGDIIVFKYPIEPDKDYIKRIMGVPGDTIKVKFDTIVVNGEKVPCELQGERRYRESEDGRPTEYTSVLYIETVNGKKHDVLYSAGNQHQNYSPELARKYNFCKMNPDGEGYLVCEIPEGLYFCMGDNRDKSNDSRFWGFVPEQNIKGKAWRIYFSWPPGQLTRFGMKVK